MNLDNPIEIQLKRESKRLGYTLRRVPEDDAWYPSIGPYYLVDRITNRVRYSRLALYEVFGVLTSVNDLRVNSPRPARF